MSVIDTNSNVAGHLSMLRQRGVTAIGRYYSSRAWKRLTRQEAAAISGADMKIFTVFEDSGSPRLTHENGVHDGQLASQQARAVGQPEGSAIYFALEGLPSGYRKKDLRAIKDYVGGVRDALDGKYKVGAYSDGVVCDELLKDGLCDFAWLSASMGFEGSREFRDSDRWSILQKTPLDQNWEGLSVDVDDAQADFGAFQIDAAHIGVHAAAFVESATGYVNRLVDAATAEWNFFGKQTYDLHGHKDHAGHTEGEDGWYQRVGVYWAEGTGTHGIDGRNHDAYWSATFISWLARKAGAGTRFRYSTQHSVYIYQGIRDFLQKRAEAGYWTQRLNEAKPEVGDLVCWARTAGVDYDHQRGGNYPGHSDFVVEVDDDQVWVIGGNVGNSVTRRPLALDAQGFLKPLVQGGETLFAIMKNRI